MKLILIGTIRLACSLAAHHERQQEQSEDGSKKSNIILMFAGFLYRFRFLIVHASEYLSHAVILICDKGTNDSQLFLAALDTLISIVTDPICQLRMDKILFKI